MTRRLFERLHAELAAPVYRTYRAQGFNGNVALRAFDETHHEAVRRYRALPWWRRF